MLLALRYASFEKTLELWKLEIFLTKIQSHCFYMIPLLPRLQTLFFTTLGQTVSKTEVTMLGISTESWTTSNGYNYPP